MRRAFAFVLTAACTADDPTRLDHPELLAVRADPPALAPGSRARIDVLASDRAGHVFVTDPDSVTGPIPIEHAADGWYVTAPADVPPPSATLDLALAVDGETRLATKDVRFGPPAVNPALCPMTIDGTASVAVTAAFGAKPTLSVVCGAPGDARYDWFTSIGTLERPLEPTVVLHADERGDGTIVVIERDDAGGVAWQWWPVHI
jgi:hypothetical protein